MKKLIAVIMILALLAPAAVLADRDPIVGVWCEYSGIVEDNETNAYYEINTFTFTADGNVFSSRYDVNEDGITTVKDYKVIGLWTNENDHYYINIGFNGAVELFFDNEDLFFPVSSYSIRARKLKPVNYALDLRK